MKIVGKAVILAACVFAANGAYAQFGGFGKLAGGSSDSASASSDVSADVNAFVTKSAALSTLTASAVTAINAAFSSEEQLASKRATLADIAKITDPKEKGAKLAALYESESAEAKRRLESGDMEKQIGGLDADKKKQIGSALLNFAIGALQAVDLSKSGQNMMQKASGNPMTITKLMPVKDALPLLGKVASDSTGFIAGVMKLAKGANIAVPAVTVSSKPVDVTV
ncbi:hypothetical protein E4K72_14215 [Oxalobacteraceae bacterium OM1]|nr:hypothetical protein E4K72_14215 [Oxalobacteraceae bacterium OM1]